MVGKYIYKNNSSEILAAGKSSEVGINFFFLILRLYVVAINKSSSSICVWLLETISKWKQEIYQSWNFHISKSKDCSRLKIVIDQLILLVCM